MTAYSGIYTFLMTAIYKQKSYPGYENRDSLFSISGILQL
jgi:hypothetical protein